MFTAKQIWYRETQIDVLVCTIEVSEILRVCQFKKLSTNVVSLYYALIHVAKTASVISYTIKSTFLTRQIVHTYTYIQACFGWSLHMHSYIKFLTV